MSEVVRRAGRVGQADGSVLLWSVADGRRGRRWRAGLVRDGRLVSSMLLEVSVDGRPGRLELTTSAGLLTLHPEANGDLHGNVVTTDGVRHLHYAWSAEHELVVDGIAITSAVAARRLAATTPAGEGRTVPVVAVGADLAIRQAVRTFHRLDAGTWWVDGQDEPMTLAIDPDGIPLWSGEADAWPLQLDLPR
jgi:hypothetical protein